MLRNGCEELPNDINLHVFSFLNTKDVVAATSVDTVNRSLYASNELWWQRLHIDFAVAAAEGQDPQQYYFHLDKQLHNEKRVIAFMLWLEEVVINRKHRRGLPNDVEWLEINFIRRILIMLPVDKFLQHADEMVEKYVKKGFSGLLDYTLEIENSYAEFHQLVNKLNLEEGGDLLDKIVIGVRRAIECNAPLLLRQLLCALPVGMFVNRISDHHARYFKDAVHNASIEVVRLLLEFGMDPNLLNINALWIREQARPLELTMEDFGCLMEVIEGFKVRARQGDLMSGTVEEVSQYFMQRIAICKSVVTMLIAHGADVDLQSIMPLYAGATIRDVALRGIREADHVVLPENEKQMILELLHLIADAPMKKVEEAEPAWKRVRV